jgi:hypothetical protein
MIHCFQDLISFLQLAPLHVGYAVEITSERVNMTLKAGINAGGCTAEGTYIKGAISLKIGDEGYLFGSARGARNCGDFRATKAGPIGTISNTLTS